MKHNSLPLWLVFLPRVILCIAAIFPVALHAEKTLQLKGVFSLPSTLTDMPEFAILYEGAQTINKDDGFFTFTLDKPVYNLSLLICEDLSFTYQKKDIHKKPTIDHLLINKEKHYRYFTLRKDDDGKAFWHNATLSSKYIPDNCLVVLMDPYLVKEIQPFSFTTDKTVIEGPKIMLESTKEQLKKSSLLSLAKSLDLSTYFTLNSVKEEWKKPGLKVSLPH